MPVDRRTFLTGALAAGVVGRSSSGQKRPESAHADLIGKTRAQLPTPALLLDLDKFESNLSVVADQCRLRRCGFRPHAKTHKCPDIARRQVRVGASGVCAATVAEAEAMVKAGIRGVLLTSPIADTVKVGRMIELARSGGQVMISVGHALEADLLAQATKAAGVVVDVLIDLDVGDRRTGVVPGKAAVELAQRIGKNRSLRMRGVQAYAGFASHTVGYANRRRVSREAMAKALDTRDQVARAGFDAGIVSGGSTGTYNIDSEIDGITELQVGSYVFMDVGYRSIGSKSGDAVYNDFKPSLTVLTTVVSATHDDRVTIDAGIKAFATDSRRPPESTRSPGLKYSRFGDEFGAVTVEGNTALPRLGDRLEFIIPHCDPTVNLYSRIHAMRGATVEAVWPIAARREA